MKRRFKKDIYSHKFSNTRICVSIFEVVGKKDGLLDKSKADKGRLLENIRRELVNI